MRLEISDGLAIDPRNICYDDGELDGVDLLAGFSKYTPKILDDLFAELYRVVKPGGTVYVECPDIVVSTSLLSYAFDSGNIELAIQALNKIYTRNSWGYSPELLIPLLEVAGWTDIHIGLRDTHANQTRQQEECAQLEGAGLGKEYAHAISTARVFGITFTRGDVLNKITA